MKIFAAAIIALQAIVFQNARAEEVLNPKLRDELISMREQDQKFRKLDPYDEVLVGETDRKNRQRLREIVKEFGWPTLPMVGKQAAQGAWLIAQHADSDPDFQREALSMITPLVELGLLPKSQVAYLHDRVNQPQRYGTQGGCTDDGKWAPREIENPALVDKRRREMGMEPLAEYIEQASGFLCRKK